MWEWTKRFLPTRPPLRAKPDPLDLFTNAMDALASAQRAHIQDLRTLVDQAHDRERDLAGMVKLVMEERFARAVATPKVRAAQPQAEEVLPDVQQFDEVEDAKIVQEHATQQDKLEKEFQEIFTEEQEYRKERA